MSCVISAKRRIISGWPFCIGILLLKEFGMCGCYYILYKSISCLRYLYMYQCGAIYIYPFTSSYQPPTNIFFTWFLIKCWNVTTSLRNHIFTIFIYPELKKKLKFFISFSILPMYTLSTGILFVENALKTRSKTTGVLRCVHTPTYK